MVEHIARSEELDPNYDSKLLLRCNVTCFVVLMLALCKYLHHLEIKVEFTSSLITLIKKVQSVLIIG